MIYHILNEVKQHPGEDYMSKITKFERSNLKQVRDEVNAALAIVSTKLGIQIQMGNVRFTENTFSGKLEGAVKSATGEVINKEVEDLKRNAGWMLKGVDITKTLVDYSLGEIKIVGLNTRRGKYPVIVEVVKTGKQYKMSIEQIRRMAPWQERAAMITMQEAFKA
jgi:PII-like signaling protein